MKIETANILYQYRKQNNLSQEELAQKIGVSRQAVSKWERAEASPDTDNLIMLAQVYGVTLDELLKGKANDENTDTYQSEQKQTQSTQTDDETSNKRVSFKNGIHVHDGKDDVDIGLNGIHISSHDGTRVSIDKNGVFVDEDGKQRVYTDEDGNIIGDSKVMSESNKNKSIWMKLPVPMLIVAAFLVLGFLGWWHPAWMLFLIIPIYYTTVESIQKKNANIFCYPVFAALVYLVIGFSPLHMWHPGWMVFITIPFYYWIVNLFKKTDD